VTDEPTMRAILRQACQTRGMKAQISKALAVHPSTVARWVDSDTEIPAPMLLLLDWFFHGTIPPQLGLNTQQPGGVLDFTESDWAMVCALATRSGKPPGKWIADVIQYHLDPVGENPISREDLLRVAEDPADYRTRPRTCRPQNDSITENPTEPPET